MKKTILLLAFMFGIVFVSEAMAEPLTPALCKQKVIEAVKLVEAEGPAAFAKLRDKNGPFFFANGEGYLWVQDMDGLLLVHINPKLEGKSLMDMKDANGSYFFINFTEVVRKYGTGWVGYVWPKPGEMKPSPKMAFVMKAVFGGKVYIVGGGVYDVTKEDIKKQFPDDPVSEE
jgi:hypothetical protein